LNVWILDERRDDHLAILIELMLRALGKSGVDHTVDMIIRHLLALSTGREHLAGLTAHST
jgi:hypothetical protein